MFLLYLRSVIKKKKRKETHQPLFSRSGKQSSLYGHKLGHRVKLFRVILQGFFFSVGRSLGATWDFFHSSPRRWG